MSTSQDKILQFCLKNCIFDGWTTELLENACTANGLDKNYWKIEFPGGAIDVVDYLAKSNDEKVAAQPVFEGMGVTAKIREAIKLRLEMNSAYKQQIKSCLAVYALHPVRALEATYRTVDSIWRAAGDTSHDWNFYSKRALLAGVYSSTLLFWLEDKSEGSAATWEFLDRRLGEVGKLNKGISKFKEKLSWLKFTPK